MANRNTHQKNAGFEVASSKAASSKVHRLRLRLLSPKTANKINPCCSRPARRVAAKDQPWDCKLISWERCGATQFIAPTDVSRGCWTNTQPFSNTPRAPQPLPTHYILGILFRMAFQFPTGSMSSKLWGMFWVFTEPTPSGIWADCYITPIFIQVLGKGLLLQINV